MRDLSVRAHDGALYLAALLVEAGLPRQAALVVADAAIDAGERADDSIGFSERRASLERSETAFLRDAATATENAAAIRRVIIERFSPAPDDDDIPW